MSSAARDAVLQPARRQPIRVAFALDSLAIGGTELNAVRTLERFDPSRVSAHLICFRPNAALLPRVQAAGIPIEEVRITSLMNVSALRAGAHIARYLREKRIEVLHAHDIYTNILAVPCARLAGVPLVIASRRWWTVANRASQGTVNRLANRLAHRVLVNTPSIGEMLAREEGVPRDRLVVIPNFVDEDAFQVLPVAEAQALREQFGLAPSSLSIGVVANLHLVKDHATLLRAMARLTPRWPSLRLVLIGDGVAREALEAQVDASGLRGNVHFAGRLSHRPGMQSLFDIVALTSREEGFPNTLVEGMASGRPVVATRAGGIVDAVAERETGFLFPVGDDEALAAALERLLADADLRRRMGDAGRRRVREQYLASQVIERLQLMYETELARAGRR